MALQELDSMGVVSVSESLRHGINFYISRLYRTFKLGWKHQRQIQRQFGKTRNYNSLILQNNSFYSIIEITLSFLIRFAVDFHLIINQIKYPIIRNPSFRIER